MPRSLPIFVNVFVFFNCISTYFSNILNRFDRNESTQRKMACSKFAQDTLLEMLRFCSRDQLERHSIVSRQLKCLIAQNFQSTPYRVFDRLNISCDKTQYTYALGQYVHDPNRADYNMKLFLGGKKCPSNTLLEKKGFSVNKMQRYFGKTVRVKQTTFSLRDDSTAMNPKIEADMETIAHLWSGQILIPLLSPEMTSQVRVLTICSPDLSLKDYPMLYSANIFHAYYTKQFKNPTNLLYFLEDPRAKPITVINCFRWNESVTLLIDLISQSFSSASIVSAFRLIIAFNSTIVHGSEVRVKEFRLENQTTNEFLQLKYVTEKEAIKICGEWIKLDGQNWMMDETDVKRHILVQRSRL
ncbi:hypothetical protein Ddc_17947 [Ditylenchus destructor]|nr:hypothetical protein Ddc_17947 [Ditylenchus destructor]